MGGSRVLHRDRLVLALLLGGAAVVLIIAFAGQLVFSVGVPWSEALVISFERWLAPLGILMVGAALTYLAPLERGRWLWALPLHVLVCVVLISVAGQIESRRMATPPGHARLHMLHRGGAPPHELFAEPPGPPPLRPRPGRRLRMFGIEGPPREFVSAVFATSRWQLHLTVYWVSVSVASAWRLRQRAAERERRALELSASLSQAKLEALRLQLQPHFLFNTLNAIATLVHRDPAAADEMITNLGELLRLVLDTTQAEVPLRQELAVVDRYLAIEQVRLGERLRIDRAVPPAALDAAVPPFMVQTLVENAVRHGVEPRRAPGMVALQVERQGDRLRLVVADDGAGLPVADVKTERRGLGLANTEARLRELYGDEARLILRAPATGGTRVEIELPWRTLPPEAGSHAVVPAAS